MTEYEQVQIYLTAHLVAYRDMPQDAGWRKFVDWMMERSRRTASTDEDKKLHNLLVLEYISDTRRAKFAICRALGLSRDCYEESKSRAIERLGILTFGVAGIKWD